MVCDYISISWFFLMEFAHAKHRFFPMDILDKRAESSGVFVEVLFVTMTLVG